MSRNTQIIVGHTLDVLRSMPAQSVHCAISSPPYWGLREYGIEPQVWAGDPECGHEWSDTVAVNATNHVDKRRWNHARNGRGEDQPTEKRPGWKRQTIEQGQFCQLCGAWAGSFGLEPTPELYVEHAVEIFREVHRVLRDDGTLWLNLGDCYATGAGKVREHPGGGERGRRWAGRDDSIGRVTSSKCDGSGGHTYYGPMTQPNRMPLPGLPPKNLVGAPWRVAFALQADGWILRSDIVWAKPSPMPESVTDRPTRSHEYLFLLTKKPAYYYDAEAIKEQSVSDHASGNGFKRDARLNFQDKDGARGNDFEWNDIGGKRNRRSVWTINSQPFPEAHFATFPPTLIEPCLKAGTSEKGCCAGCGAPWKRIVEPSEEYAKHLGKDWADYDQDDLEGRGHFATVNGWKASQRPIKRKAASISSDYETKGWQPTCKCGIPEVAPAVVLDPFGGAGTTGLVAARLDRASILIELNPSYAEMARNRITNDAPLLNHVTVTEFAK